MIALGAAREDEIGATIDALRQTPGGCHELAALLPENLQLYEGRTSAEMTRIRGYLLAAFADTGLPGEAMPYVLESLESGHLPYEIAGAAIALRGLENLTAQLCPYLLRALRNLIGGDATVSFECYDPRWPYREPTTAMTEILGTLARLGTEAAVALPELERMLDEPSAFSSPVRAEMQSASEAIRRNMPAVVGVGSVRAHQAPSCCGSTSHGAAIQPLRRERAVAPYIALEDQDGRLEMFMSFVYGKPTIVVFFYTRCDNPYKCSLTITKLGRLQMLMSERGLEGRIRLAAITYDPEFDSPKRLKRYGCDRGVVFGDDVRFFRTRSGLDQLSTTLRLQVNYGPATINRHQIESYVLDAYGRVARAFTRLQWEPADVLDAALEARVD
jgi:protein SCO1